MREYSERMQAIEEKKQNLKEKLQRLKTEERNLNQRELDKIRRTQTRLKILVGAVVVRDQDISELLLLSEKMTEKDKKYFSENIHLLKTQM